MWPGNSYDSTSGGEREIQRTMLELLNQLDGFDSRGDVKVGGALAFTGRAGAPSAVLTEPTGLLFGRSSGR